MQALTGQWASKHSEELKRGITIKLGYADFAIYKCPDCEEPQCYCTSEDCTGCEKKAEFQRAISFVDAPGHEILMATMLSGAAVMDGAILVIAANEKCPQPQTREHLAAIDTLGLKNIVIVQNKIDLVKRDDAIRSHNDIVKFVDGTVAESAPIIPVSAQHNVNIDLLLQAIQEYLPTPKRNQRKPGRMHIVRSFDVNNPGTLIEELGGGVLGGSIYQGSFKVGQEVEIKPGLPTRDKNKLKMKELVTEITSLHIGNMEVEEALPGGLVGIGTVLDPSLSKSDGLVGSLLGKPGTLPPVRDELSLNIKLFTSVVGSKDQEKVASIAKGEKLLLNVGTAKTMADITAVKKDYLEAKLSIPICGEETDHVALSRRIDGRWRLIGAGTLTK